MRCPATSDRTSHARFEGALTLGFVESPARTRRYFGFLGGSDRAKSFARCTQPREHLHPQPVTPSLRGPAA